MERFGLQHAGSNDSAAVLTLFLIQETCCHDCGLLLCNLSCKFFLKEIHEREADYEAAANIKHCVSFPPQCRKSAFRSYWDPYTFQFRYIAAWWLDFFFPPLINTHYRSMSIWRSSHSYCINEQKLHHKSGKREEKLSQWDEFWCNYYVKRNKSNSICEHSHSRLNTILACLWARTSTLLYPWGVGGAEYTVGAAWMMEDVSWMGGRGPCLDAEADTIETISDT